MDDNGKGGLIQFWELFIVMPNALKDFKHKQEAPTCIMGRCTTSLKPVGLLCCHTQL